MLFLLMTLHSFGQRIMPLYEGAIPNSKPTKDVEKTSMSGDIKVVDHISIPTLTIYLPDERIATGTAVIIFPGGGYWVNAIAHEGTDVARKFTDVGVAAVVVKYRIPSDETMVNREIGPLQDAQQAMIVVRQHADEWKIDSHRIGIMGFSAGGHLASTAGTHFENPVVDNPAKVSLRPDFMILGYPVVSFQDSICHRGSREQLIGKTPTKEKIDFYSNELQVTARTPPTFLVHASDDQVVVPQNSIVFYEYLLRHKVPAELHIYEKGGHGFGLNNKTTVDLWFDRCKAWMSSNGWLNPK
ncbi:alpha/beta hydrolase [Chryseolinea sp. Jin1]|uniref:Alpha/beta hydrolase n=2 Tax=Chryseolinea lacunae TaxID=2801331 RepID=A0ABS1L3C2_9BACT|nr:alpha/beta hydrolase [Chryseolinea lacunae]